MDNQERPCHFGPGSYFGIKLRRELFVCSLACAGAVRSVCSRFRGLYPAFVGLPRTSARTDGCIWRLFVSQLPARVSAGLGKTASRRCASGSYSPWHFCGGRMESRANERAAGRLGGGNSGIPLPFPFLAGAADLLSSAVAGKSGAGSV